MRQRFRKYLCYCINVIKRNRLQCYDWHTLLGSWTFLIMLLAHLLLVTFLITLPSSAFSPFDWSFFIESYHPDNFSEEPYGRYFDGLYHICLFHFVVLVYGVIIPVFFALRFKFRKKYFVIIDFICLSFLFPTTFRYCVIYNWFFYDNNEYKVWFSIIKFVVLLYTLSILYFRSLYYKHIEAVAAKDDEEKRQKTLRTNKTSL